MWKSKDKYLVPNFLSFIQFHSARESKKDINYKNESKKSFL